MTSPAGKEPIMSSRPAPDLRPPSGIYSETVHLRTQRLQQFVDITDLVAERVRRARVGAGIVNVQSRHTTASILVNEFEPELLSDLDDLGERWAPRALGYRHDRRELPPGERANGHSHARAILLGSSATLNVQDGRLCLGRWQRVLLAELDGPRRRGISIVVLGVPEGDRVASRPWPRIAKVDRKGA
jgi:secondary thiamine-phosphate synthase enzyme